MDTLLYSRKDWHYLSKIQKVPQDNKLEKEDKEDEEGSSSKEIRLIQNNNEVIFADHKRVAHLEESACKFSNS